MLEELLGLAISVVFQAGGAKDRIIEGNRDWRIVATQRITLGIALVLGSEKCIQRRLAALKKLCPALQSLTSRHGATFNPDICYVFKLFNSLVFHDCLHCLAAHPIFPVSTPIVPPELLRVTSNWVTRALLEHKQGRDVIRQEITMHPEGARSRQILSLAA